MAVTQIDLAPPSGAKMYSNDDLENTASAVKASSGTIYGIVVDNSANGADSYVKLWNVASGSVTVGTTAPDLVLKVAASVKRTFVFPEGEAFGTAITAACVTTAGTAGTTSPSSSVPVSIVYT